MRTLVVYYSRTGTTKTVGEAIAAILKCDKEEIVDTKDRSGVIGWLYAGRDATRRMLTNLMPIKKDPAVYELVIIGTPVWSLNMCAATRTYIEENKKKFRRVAFFCTLGRLGGKRTFTEMETACGKKPVAALELTTKEVKDNKYSAKIKKFIGSIK